MDLMAFCVPIDPKQRVHTDTVKDKKDTPIDTACAVNGPDQIIQQVGLTIDTVNKMRLFCKQDFVNYDDTNCHIVEEIRDLCH